MKNTKPYLQIKQLIFCTFVTLVRPLTLFTNIWQSIRQPATNAIHKTCLKGVSLFISRLKLVSGKAKKKQHAHLSSGLYDQYSELFTLMAALKFDNTVANLGPAYYASIILSIMGHRKH